MSDTYGSPEFDFEEPIQMPAKKKTKLIGLDDLLEDYKEEQKRLNKKESVLERISKACDADDEADDDAEARLSECVTKCQKEINRINGDEEMPSWGIEVFGEQEKLPQNEYPELKSCALLKSFLNHDINSLVELDIEKGGEFLEGLLVDDWLLNLVNASGCVEKTMAKWTFSLMLYSSNIRLMEAACEFWCAILSTKDNADSSSIKIDWLPKFSDLKRALKAYGFLLDSPSMFSSDVGTATDCIIAGPPQNIRAWIKCATFCCQRRVANVIFSTQEVEDLLVIIISFFLDRQLVCLSMVLHESVLSLVNFFGDEEWPSSCNKVANSLAHRKLAENNFNFPTSHNSFSKARNWDWNKSILCLRLPCNINCLRIVESVVGVDGRSKQLRGAVAFQFLVTCLDEKVSDAKEILRLLISINVKDKDCDLFQMFIYLSLAENWLLFDTMVKDKAELRELWGICLRNCSCGITITDLRSYASNVRSKASYLLQGSTSKCL